MKCIVVRLIKPQQSQYVHALSDKLSNKILFSLLSSQRSNDNEIWIFSVKRSYIFNAIIFDIIMMHGFMCYCYYLN